MALSHDKANGVGSVDEFYVDDVNFNSGYVHRLSPAVMNFVARFRGALDTELSADFHYCELACGDGSTTNVLAGLYPEAEFVGVDFNSRHITDAEAGARELGLHNVKYICCSFEDLAQHELPQFDYAGINGAYGWLTPDLQAAVRVFLAAHLKDDGLFAVEYLSLPGKAAIQSMWKTVQKLYPVDAFSSSQQRGVAGVKFLNAFNAANPQVFKAHPSVKNATRRYLGQVKSKQGNVDHFIHNALAGGFEARYFCDVYDEMSEVGLRYAGRVDALVQNDESFGMGPARFRLLNQFDSPRERELVRDFLLNTDSRVDLYIKSPVQPKATLSIHAFDPYYALSVISLEALSSKPYRELFSNKDLEFVAALDGRESLAEVFAGDEASALRLSLINRLLDSNEVFLAQNPWLDAVADCDNVEMNSPLAKSHLERIFERGMGGRLPVPGQVNTVVYGAAEIALLALLLEFGMKAGLRLLEERVGKSKEALPGKYSNSALSQKQPKILLEQAQKFYAGPKLEFLLRSGVLTPC